MTGSDPLPSLAPETEVPYPFWNYHDVILFVVAVVVSLVVSLLVVSGLRSLFTAAPVSKGIEALVAQFLWYALSFLCLRTLLKLQYERPFWASLAWQGSRRAIALAMFCGPALAIVVAIGGFLLDPPQIDNPFRDFLRDRLTIAAFGVFATIFGPLSEELAFRGFLQPLLSRTFGVVVGILLANLPFALLHGPMYAWSWQHIVLVGSAGLVFGLVRKSSGSTAAAAGIHATYNLTFFTASVLQRGTQFSQW